MVIGFGRFICQSIDKLNFKFGLIFSIGKDIYQLDIDLIEKAILHFFHIDSAARHIRKESNKNIIGQIPRKYLKYDLSPTSQYVCIEAIVQRCSVKKGVLRNFAKFIGKHLCQSLFFNKVETLLKKRLWHRRFSVNFVKFLKTLFCIEQLWWLLLSVKDSFIEMICLAHMCIVLIKKIML